MTNDEKPPPGCELPAEAYQILERVPNIQRGLIELKSAGYVRSRVNPITGLTEWRITKKGIRAQREFNAKSD